MHGHEMVRDERHDHDRRAAIRGVIAFGRPTDDRLADLVGGRDVRSIHVPDHPWALHDTVCAGVVDDDASHAAALDVAMRGADVVAEVAPERLADFVEDLERIGIARWVPTTAAPSHTEWGPLLDALRAGLTTEEAARRCHLSVRSAHRRLATARAVLGVSTTAAAVARWSATADR